MAPFMGFSTGKTRTTPLPEAFFAELLPQIDHLGELKVTLYTFWFLNQQEGHFRFITRGDFSNDHQFMVGLARDEPNSAAILADALERAVQRGTLLKVASTGSDEELYFVNTPRGRAAVESLARGEWTPELSGRPQPELALERPNVFRLYEENIGPLTPMIADVLREAEKIYPGDWIEEAVRIAVMNNVRRWRYIEAILRSWNERGRDGTDRRDLEQSRRKYLEGEFAEFIQH